MNKVKGTFSDSLLRWSILLTALFFVMFSRQTSAQQSLYTNQFPLSDVILTGGPFKHARDLNIQTLLKYDTDKLLAGYRKEAGLPAKATSFSNWDGLDGHVAGHYLSALAMNFAATGNAECKQRLDYLISELNQCQQANGQMYPDWAAGYVGAVPNGKELWPKIKSGDIAVIWKYWVPWYNVHKMYAGLKDAWLYAGNEEAKIIFLKFCDWAIDITKGLSDAQMEEMLGNEHGGMNEVFADAFQITGDRKFLDAAKRFSHKQILYPLSANNDELDNKHANTQVPKAIGFQRIGELAGDEIFSQAGKFFWQTVTGNRSLAFGGNSRREFFPSVTSCTDFVNEVEGPESCNSYNMLKLTQHLFRKEPSAIYMDYYERTLYNHILSTQHPEHGGYVYFTPARPRHYRVYSSPNHAMWCCVGSGMENHCKYNELIYTHINDSLYVNLFIESELNWNEKGVKLKQETSFPYEDQTRVTITEGSSEFTIMIRCPFWVKNGEVSVVINGNPLVAKPNSNSYIKINRTWKKGDIIQITLPMQTRIEHMPNVPEYVAIMHGPVLLAAKTGTEDLKGLVADDSRWGHIASGKRLPIDQTPIIIEDDIKYITNKIKPISGKPLSFSVSSLKMVNPAEVELVPFFTLHDVRYMMYWMALTGNQYKSYLDSLALQEKKKLELQARTIDYVALGEQQPEADHGILHVQSGTGNRLDEFYREARSEGFFSYKLNTKGQTGLTLMVRYWGAEWGNRKFDIYIDDEKLISENNTGRWNQSSFKDIEYRIPDAMVSGKDHIRVKFQALPDNTAGAVFGIRLVK
ncbi:MAG: glycoside hydrolase family 127 protein [Chitinophagaceae bacterium]|nr:glycoside hydrolase family 127 protein [Chitinophagaceae bacterium]